MFFKHLPWRFSKWSKTWIFYADKGLEDKYQSEKYASDVLTMFIKPDDCVNSKDTKDINTPVIINCNNNTSLLNLTCQIQRDMVEYILG